MQNLRDRKLAAVHNRQERIRVKVMCVGVCQREDLTRHVPARKHSTRPPPEEESLRHASARVPAKDDDTMDLIMKDGVEVSKDQRLTLCVVFACVVLSWVVVDQAPRDPAKSQKRGGGLDVLWFEWLCGVCRSSSVVVRDATSLDRAGLDRCVVFFTVVGVARPESTTSHVRLRRSTGSAPFLCMLLFLPLPRFRFLGFFAVADGADDETSPSDMSCAESSLGFVFLVFEGLEDSRRRASSSECLKMAICSSVRVRLTPSG